MAARFAAAIVAAGMTGCGDTADSPGRRRAPRDSSADEIPAHPPDIEGTITRVQPGDSVPNGAASCPPSCPPVGAVLLVVLVEEIPGGLETTGGKSYVTVRRETRVFRQARTGISAADLSDLQLGRRTRAWFAGPAAESYPTRATARTLVVLDR